MSRQILLQKLFRKFFIVKDEEYKIPSFFSELNVETQEYSASWPSTTRRKKLWFEKNKETNDKLAKLWSFANVETAMQALSIYWMELTESARDVVLKKLLPKMFSKAEERENVPLSVLVRAHNQTTDDTVSAIFQFWWYVIAQTADRYDDHVKGDDCRNPPTLEAINKNKNTDIVVRKPYDSDSDDDATLWGDVVAGKIPFDPSLMSRRSTRLHARLLILFIGEGHGDDIKARDTIQMVIKKI